VLLNSIFGFLALLSFLLLLWQWIVARRFPLHRKRPDASLGPGVTLLKPLKGCDHTTESCLRSWFELKYEGPVQILFGVASADDPVCELVTRLIREAREQPESSPRTAELVVCGPLMGPNAKVSKLVQLEKLAMHELLVISDADVKVVPDFLSNFIQPLARPATSPPSAGTGLVNCFYRLANPTTKAMRWEAVAINADFWSQVLQAQSLKPIDFALGAVMGIRKQQLLEIGGFESLINCLADDYQLGNRISRRGYQIEIATVPVECWSVPMGWREVWNHQLRWARTIRVSQPAPYFFSILGNATLWSLLWMVVKPNPVSGVFAAVCLYFRMLVAVDLQRRLLHPGMNTDEQPADRDKEFQVSDQETDGKILSHAWMAPVKDLVQTAIWFLSFLGNQVEWRGEKLRLNSDGTLEEIRPRMDRN
jgi:ceramide glucosyltransferase